MIVQGTKLSMIRGDSEGIRVSVVDEAGDKVPLIAGDTVYFTVKDSVSTIEVELQKIITEFIDGEALITIYPEDTKHMAFREYVYDIQLNRANGQVKTIVPTSRMRIMSEVTDE